MFAYHSQGVACVPIVTGEEVITVSNMFLWIWLVPNVASHNLAGSNARGVGPCFRNCISGRAWALMSQVREC